MNRFYFVASGMTACILFLALSAHAQTATTKFVPLTGADFGSVQLAPFLSGAFQSGSMDQLFNAAFKSALALGAILAVLRIAYAGFQYMVSDLWTSKEHAKSILKSAVTGLLLLLAIWLILHQINPQILTLNILQSSSAGTPRPCTGGGC